MRMLEHLKNIKRHVRGLSLLPLFLFALLLLDISCSSIDCPVQNVVATVYALKKSDGTAETLKNASLTVTTRRKNGTDTIILDNVTDISRFQLPIGYSNPEDTLLFSIKKDTETYADTVYIKKENMPHFESVDCNISYFHTISDIRLGSHHAIESISINKPEVNYDLSTEHLHIVFKTTFE